MPGFVEDGDLARIHQPLDLLGVNYYATTRVRLWDGTTARQNNDGHKDMGGSAWPGSPQVEFVAQDGPHTAMGWNIDPDGLEELLLDLHRRFPDQPLVITENGAVFEDHLATRLDGSRTVHDPERVDYLHRHFAAAHRALAAGVDLRGYFVWSLMDNFEWGYGYSKRFGIVHVDYETQRRTLKDSALRYRRLATTGTIPSLEPAE